MTLAVPPRRLSCAFTGVFYLASGRGRRQPLQSLEAAVQAADAALDLRELLRLAAVRANGRRGPDGIWLNITTLVGGVIAYTRVISHRHGGFD